MSDSPPDIETLDLAGLKALVFQLLEANATLKAENAVLRDEIARLKGLKGRPKIKPSGMEKETQAKSRRGRGRRRGAKRLAIDEDQILEVSVPAGSRFKGYEDFIVQDLIVKSHVVRYRRARWVTPAGRTVLAPLPAGVLGHFGAELRRYLLAQYYQGQVTMPRLVAQLGGLGVTISKRQVGRLLSAHKEDFLAETREVLRAGLESAAWISVDDTGARHKGHNGVCTQIGNDRFAVFTTTAGKSRLNFLELLRAGKGDYVVNEAALAYMRRRKLAGPLIARLAAQEVKRFAEQGAWAAHLDRLGIAERKVEADPVRIATEGALWGSVVDHGFVRNAVILSDDAGQFNVGHHALCWVHAERLIHKLDGFNDRQRQAIACIRTRFWRLYAELKAYCRDPTPRAKAAIKGRFERLFNSSTGYPALDRLLGRLRANRDELLVVLDRPEVPLHTNGSENDIRCQVTKRKISGGTRSDQGRDCRDAFLGLLKTCDKQRISFWDYLGHRLSVPGAPNVPYLPNLIALQQQNH